MIFIERFNQKEEQDILFIVKDFQNRLHCRKPFSNMRKTQIAFSRKFEKYVFRMKTF